ncbi:MAG: hypothetical protein AAGI91_05480 [Bacteroidota bacterium]
MPAQTVDDAYIAVKPDEPLQAGDAYYEDFAVWRGDESVSDLIARMIRRSNRATPVDHVKQLFTGHRGCGKSSELLRLKARLEEQGFFVAYLDSTFALDVSDVSYTDVLIALVLAVAQAADEAADLDLDVPDGIVEGLNRRLGAWVLEDTVTRGGETEVEAEAKLGGGIPGLLKLALGLQSTLKAGAEKKQTLRTTIDQGVTAFLDDLNIIIDDLQIQLRDRGKEGLVLIMDSLDRIVLKTHADGRGNTHTDLFIDHAYHLKAPRCHVVYTVPISICFERNLLPLYDRPRILPMVKVRERQPGQEEGDPCEGALSAMTEAVARRMDLGLFEDPDDVRRLCQASGGHIRDLMHLLRDACNYSEEQITPRTVDRAIQGLTNIYDLLVRDADLPKLVQVHREKRLPADPEYARLPYHLLVLQYKNGEQWADVHPAVLRMSKFRRALDAVDDETDPDGRPDAD